MTELVQIEKRTVKQQMNDVLLGMKVGEQFTIDRADRGKWATHISYHVHPLVPMRFSVITDRKVADGKIIVRRVK